MAGKKRGPKPDPDRVIMRKTLVQDEPTQMELLEELGYTHSEAYRIGSRILTKTKTPAVMETEALIKEANKARLDADAASARYQALLSMIEEARETQARAEQAKQDKEEAIKEAARLLYESGNSIRNASQGNAYRINKALDLLEPGNITADEIRILFRSGKTVPSLEKILQFIKTKQF